MCDGKRTFKITMTNAQYDVLKAAVDQVLDDWKERGHYLASSRPTLKRAFKHISDEFEMGAKS